MSTLRILGSADWHVTAHNDNSCYLIDDCALIDACSTSIMQMLNAGIDPLNVNTIFFTHLHADHCLGLAPFLHYWMVRMAGEKRMGDFSDLTIVGHRAMLRRAVELALNIVMDQPQSLEQAVVKMPKLVELEGECVYEHPRFHVEVMNSDHAVPGLCYRFTNRENGKVIGFTGDTKYRSEFGKFFANADALVHEASFGAGPVPPIADTTCRHSSAIEAARVATEANVRRLILTHTYEPKRAGAIEEAKKRLTIPVEWAMPETVIEY